MSWSSSRATGSLGALQNPARPGRGHLWRWELFPLSGTRTAVAHTYDWTALTDERRFARARATTADKLRASLDRLAALAEAPRREMPPGLAGQLSGSSYHGLATFAQRPFLTEIEQLEAWRPDVAIVGAPFDISTTNRPGARFGPRAIRADAYDPGTYHMDLGLDFVDWLEVVDFGDAHCPHGLTEVAPAYDHADLTVNAAHRVVLEALSGMAARRRDAAGVPKGPPARLTVTQSLWRRPDSFG
jgi:hypothetical protein